MTDSYSSLLTNLAEPTESINVTPDSQLTTASTASSVTNTTKPIAIETAEFISLESVIHPTPTSHVPPTHLFDVNQFVTDVKIQTENRNKEMAMNTVMINSYAIAHDCIREAFFKIMNYPARSYQSAYVPIKLKSILGNAVHDFIQSHATCFTELETSVKVPSIRTSTRMDGLINDDVVVEIKSCTFKDYTTILNTKRPRNADFLQGVLYKYLLENHLEEAKRQTNVRTAPPKLDKYNIRYLQFIYVANDVLASDANNESEALRDVTAVKKMLNSKYNQFYFINAITIDLASCDITEHYKWIIGKINALNNYINNNKIPPKIDPFVSKNCFFCIYKDVCNQYQ